MNNLIRLFFLFGLATSSACSAEQASPQSVQSETDSVVAADFSDLLSNGTVSLLRATGNGGSSGPAVEGVVVNNSAQAVAVDIVMSAPVLFRNGGKGQNMIGSMVLRRDGSYLQEGQQSFVSLNPHESADLTFIAYCTDFDLNNPTSDESFSVGPPPPALAKVMANIANYARMHPNIDITVSAQVAVWLAQGVEADRIQSKFPFSSTDEALARSFLQ